MRRSRARRFGIVAILLLLLGRVAPAEARWAAAGIGCFSGASFADLLAQAASGDLVAPVDFDTSLGPSVQLGQASLFIQGDWNYDGTAGFPPPSCSGPANSNEPPAHFARDGNPQEFFGNNSGVTVGDGPLLTALTTIRQLTIEELALRDAWASGDGGLLAGDIHGGARVTLKNVELTGGRSSGQGGGAAFTLRGASILTITGDPCSGGVCASKISDGHAGEGYSSGNAPGSGGLVIDVREGSRLVIENTEISDNQAAGSAGGFKIIVRDGSSVVLRNNIIKNNKALGLDVASNSDPRNGGGGRIQIYDGTVRVEGNTFQGNQAPNGRGGALAIEKVGTGGSALLYLIPNNVFSSNSAGLGNNDLYLNGITIVTPRVYLPVTRR